MAIFGNYNPSVIIHELAIGSVFNGAESNGVLDTIGSGKPYYTGRVNFHSNGTAGGLFTAPSVVGASFDGLIYKGLGTTRVIVSLETELYPSSTPVASESVIFDTNNQTTFLGAINPTSFTFQPVRPLFVLPNARIKVTSVGALTSIGRLECRFDTGWGILPMQGIN